MCGCILETSGGNLNAFFVSYPRKGFLAGQALYVVFGATQVSFLVLPLGALLFRNEGRRGVCVRGVCVRGVCVRGVGAVRICINNLGVHPSQNVGQVYSGVWSNLDQPTMGHTSHIQDSSVKITPPPPPFT